MRSLPGTLLECVHVSISANVCVTRAAERLLGSDAAVAGGAQCGRRHGQRGEEVAIVGACLPLPRLLLPLLQPLLLLLLQGVRQRRIASQGHMT